MPWKPPLTKAGHPCKKCQKGKPCSSHRKRRKTPKSAGKRTSYKLNRELLDDLPTIVERSRCYTEIWESLDISHKSFYTWMHQGEADVEAGKATMFREFYEIVTYHRRLLAQRLKGVAVRAAEGVIVQKETEDGPRIYQLPPDGRLAASIARSLDPEALPPEKQEVKHEHDGPVEIILWRPEDKKGGKKRGR